MQSQPGTNPALIRAELMRFASSELLKIETALVRKPNAGAPIDALAFEFRSDLPAEAAQRRRLVEVNGIEPMTSCLQSRRSPN